MFAAGPTVVLWNTWHELSATSNRTGLNSALALRWPHFVSWPSEECIYSSSHETDPHKTGVCTKTSFTLHIVRVYSTLGGSDKAVKDVGFINLMDQK